LQVLINVGLIGYKFRSPHEAKMAVVAMDNSVRARTPLSEEWRRKKEQQQQQAAQTYAPFREQLSDESSISTDGNYRILASHYNNFLLYIDDSEKPRPFRPRHFSSRRGPSGAETTHIDRRRRPSDERRLSNSSANAAAPQSTGYYYKKKLMVGDLFTHYSL